MTVYPDKWLEQSELIGEPPETDSGLWTRKHPEITATRHLCAGVYLDREFRDFVIRKVHNATHSRVAPSYAFDLLPVVRHAWYAWLLETAHYLLVLLCFVLGWRTGGSRVFLVLVCALIAGALLRFAVRGMLFRAKHGTTTAGTARAKGLTAGKTLRRSAAPSVRAIKSALGLAALVLLAVDQFGVQLPLLGATGLMLLGLLLLCAFLRGLATQVQLNGLYLTGELRPEKLSRREQALDAQQKAVSVIYHRPAGQDDLDPLERALRDKQNSLFLGGGRLVNRWLPPMIVPLRSPEGVEYTQAPFQAHELVEQLRFALLQLGSDTGTENLHGLRVNDRVYFAASDISGEALEVLDQPTQQKIWALIDDHSTVGNHFLETTVPILGGELVTSVLIQVSVKGRTLSLDVATCALTRTPCAYHVADPPYVRGVRAALKTGLRSAFSSPSYLWRSWRLLTVPLVLAGAWRASRKSWVSGRAKIYLAGELAVRKDKSDPWEDSVLDHTTIYDHMKIIEQRILKTAEKFLEENGIDASNFTKRAMQIINSGVLNMGNVEMNNSAMGDNNQVQQNVTTEGTG